MLYDIIVPEHFMSFCVIYDHVTMTYVTITYDVMLTPNPSSE